MCLRGWSLLLLLGLFGVSWADVVINEVQSVNDVTCVDEDGASGDWIELFNAGTETVDLGGWGLSDKKKQPFKWVFPSGTTLAPQAHLRVFADGKNRTNRVETAGIRTPDTVDGLCLWLCADDLVHTVANGGAVASWPDRSGKDNAAAQTTAKYRPTLAHAAVLGHAAVNFAHASAQMLRLPTPFAGMSSFSNASVYAVCKWSGTTTTVGLFGQWYANGNSKTNSHFEIQSGGTVRWRIADVDFKAANVLPSKTWSVVGGISEMARETPQVALYLDGAQVARKEGKIGATTFTLPSTYLFLGNSCALPSSTSHRGFDGQIAEVAWFDHALTAEERAGINAYFERKYLKGEVAFHTNFSLSGEGETLSLTRADGTLADRVTFARIPCDTSWGRSPDGAATFAYFATPTPAASNAVATYAAPLEAVAFSPERGVFTTPQTVTLAHADPAATIYYTRDHSEPSATNGVRYTGTPIGVTASTIIRATAVKAGALPCRNVATHSYLFLADACANPGVPTGFPSVWSSGGTSKARYGVSATQVATDADRDALVAALGAAPILSITLPDAELFGSSAGVYTHPQTDGLEAVASCEWIGTNGVGRVQVDAGLRAQGAASRQFGNQPKKSFRLCFRGRYGASALSEPVLDAAGAEDGDFNTLILRAEYNNSWTHKEAAQRLRGTCLRDQFMRDIFRDMDQPGPHGTEVHLFLNGYYWGVYNLTERPDAAYGARLFGGEKDDWDVIKSYAEVRDGDAAAWKRMYAAATNATAVATTAGYAAVTSQLDIVNFADYMLLNHWGGNQDWPQNNWTALRRRVDGEKWRFCVWDAERTLENVSDNRLGAKDEHPGRIHSTLMNTAAYRQLYTARAQRHFHPRHGVLAATNAVTRWDAGAAAVRPIVFGELARWGAYRSDVGDAKTIYDLSVWETEIARVRDTYLPQRGATFQTHLQAKGLWTEPDWTQACVFLPTDKANWDNDDNWSTGIFPDYPGAQAFIGAPATNGVDDAKGWRNIRIKNHAVIVGSLTIENGSLTNRVTNKDEVVPGADDGLIFDGAGAAAVLAVRDTAGTGCAVFDSDYPTRWTGDLRVIVDNPEGSPEFGALRLQQTWESTGAFIKEGPGRCSLTGAGKNWTGGTRVKAGLLSATAKSFPSGVVTLEPGARFLVVGAGRADEASWRARFALDGSVLAEPARLHLWCRATTEGLLFSALLADPGLMIFIRGEADAQP